MLVRSLIALSFFAACAAITADNTPPVAPVKPVQDKLSIRKLFTSDQRLLRMAVVHKNSVAKENHGLRDAGKRAVLDEALRGLRHHCGAPFRQVRCRRDRHCSTDAVPDRDDHL